MSKGGFVMTAKQKKELKRLTFVWGMLAIPILNFLVFFVYVNLDSILMAFRVQHGREFYWGLANFARFFKEFSTPNSVLPSALKNTMIFFMVSVIVELPLSVVICYFIYKKVRGYKAFRVIFYLPSIVSGAVYVTLFKYIISYEGPVSMILELFGKEPIPFLTDSRYALKTIVFYNVFLIGGHIILLGGAYNKVDEGIIEAGALDGTTLRTELWYLIIPLIWPTLSTMYLLSLAGIFSASGPILAFTDGAYDTFTLSYWLYFQVKEYGAATNYPAAVGLIFTCIGTPLALLFRKLANKVPTYDD